MKKIFKKSKKEENEDYVESSDIQSEEVAAPTETTESMSIDSVSSVHLSAPDSIACSTAALSFMRNSLILPVSICSIELFKIGAYFLVLSIFTM